MPERRPTAQRGDGLQARARSSSGEAGSWAPGQPWGILKQPGVGQSLRLGVGGGLLPLPLASRAELAAHPTAPRLTF